MATWRDWDREDSAEGARALVAAHGDDLVNEWGYWSRLGESARIWAYEPHAWWTGGALEPSLLTFNTGVLVGTLLLLWVMFWREERPLLGALLVAAVGSSPTLLFHTYAQENIFAMQSCLALALLALHLPVLRRGLKPAHIGLAGLSGLLIGVAAQIRAESVAIVGCCLLAYGVLAPRGGLRLRTLLCAVVLASTFATLTGINRHFETKRVAAVAFVEEHGGTPYEGFTQPTHGFWHPIFCGLGDFGQHLGYKWDDRVAYRYALPILRERYGLDVPYPNTTFPQRHRRRFLTDLYYGPTNHYAKKFEDLAPYSEILREKVLGDIGGDPLWYASVLARRGWRVLTKASPVQLRVGQRSVPVPFSGVLLLPFLLFAGLRWRRLSAAPARDRLRLAVAIVVFCLPLATNSVVMFSGKNSTYNGCFHLVLLAVLLAWALRGGFDRALASRTQRPSSRRGTRCSRNVYARETGTLSKEFRQSTWRCLPRLTGNISTRMKRHPFS